MADFSAPVSDYMSTPLLTVGVLTPLGAAATVMRDNDVSSVVGVSAAGEVSGLLTFSDLLRVGTRRPSEGELLSFPEQATVSDAMSTGVKVVEAGATCAEAAAIMVQNRFHRLVVNRDGEGVGVLSPFDLMKLIVHEGLETSISKFMSAPLVTIEVDATVSAATERLDQSRVSGLVVLEGEWLVGLFTQREALESRHYDRKTAVESVMTPAFIALESGTAMHRAAASALALGARRVVATVQGRPEGMLSGIDFARAVAEVTSSPKP